MKSVAIWGFAPQTRELVNLSDAEEVWSLNNFYNYGLPEERVTRTFEIHELWMQYVYAFSAGQNSRGQAYWDWLRSPHPFPVYMAKVKADFVKDYKEIKRRYLTEQLSDAELQLLGVKMKEIEIAVEFFDNNQATILRYPLEEVIDNIFPEIPNINTDIFPRRGIIPYFVSSIDYMSALAIYEGFERIEYYGVELKEKTEWAMQKSGATFWAGVARGRGIEVLTPKASVLIKAPLYGIETGAQMIPIQIPEELARMLSLEFDRQRNLHNHYTGKFTTMVDRHKELTTKIDEKKAKAVEIENQGHIDDANKIRYEINLIQAEADNVRQEMAKIQQDADGAVVKMYLAEGGMNAMRHLIKNENLELEPLSLETITRLEYLEGENEPEKVKPA